MESTTFRAPVRMQDAGTGEYLSMGAAKIYAALDGPFARTSLVLEFHSHLGRTIEADLVFPLPPSAALSELSIRLAGRSVEAKMRPRARAQADYRKAVEAGQSAVLGEAEGDDLARVRVAPVEPGDRVEVLLVLHHLLDPIDEGHRLLWPLTYMPRFVEDASAATATALAAEERPRPAQMAARATVVARVLRRPGRAVSVRCASHAAQVEAGPEHLLVTVGPTPLDRDLHLDVLDRPRGDEPVVWFCHDGRPQSDGLGAATAAAIVPPLYPGETPAVARTVTFLVDRSGSMKGAPMASALQAVRESLRTLSAADRFNILAFDDKVEALADRPVAPEAEALEAAERFLSGVDARGGTRASDALLAALDERAAASCSPLLRGMPRPDAGHRLRLVVFMTDGDVAGTAGVLSAAREKLVDTRIHVLGIGPSVHHGMLGEIARIGGGTYEPVATSDDLEKALRSLSAAMAGPLWTGIQVTLRDGAQRRPPPELEPAGPVDLFAGRPLLLAWRGPLPPGARLVLSGQRRDGDASVEINLGAPPPPDAPSAAILWALLRNRRLAYRFDPKDDPALEDLGVQFGVVNRAVALVGVDPQRRDAVVQGSVPVSLPMPTQAQPAPAQPAPSGARGKMTSLSSPGGHVVGGSFINYMSREIRCKIVLHGPALAGKATNLAWLLDRLPGATAGQMDDGIERVLSFEALLSQVQIRGFSLRVHVYTVTGQAFYNANRKLILRGADGVIFVADSDPEREEANAESLDNLGDCLADVGLSLQEMPLVIQYNKRDLPNALPIDQMRALLNARGVHDFEASASVGVGVMETFKGILRLAVDSLRTSAT